MKNKPIRVMIYDDSTLRDGWDGFKEDGLALSWKWGDKLYRMFGGFDVSFGAQNINEALDYLVELSEKEKISQIQFWCHGWPGRLYLGDSYLDERSFYRNRETAKKISLISERMTDDGLFWFRACSTFAGEAGQTFAKRFVELINNDNTARRAAGHTYIIGMLQSGLYTLGKNEEPGWDVNEGLVAGESVSFPQKLQWSNLFRPNTILFLRGAIPKGW